MPFSLSLVLASLVVATPLPSESGTRAPQQVDAPTVHALNFNLPMDLTIAAGGAAVAGVFLTPLVNPLAAQTCRWCDRAPDGTDTLNTLDRWGRGVAGQSAKSREDWSRTSAHVLIDGVVLIVSMQSVIGARNGNSLSEWGEDMLMIAEPMAVSAAANQAVKLLVARERPFVHVLTADQKGLLDDPGDNNSSFYSAHTSLIFSAVTAAGTVSELRGYKCSWIIWAVGLPIATFEGLTRMIADKHYLTDVLVGAAVGSLFGVGMPLLLHGRKTQNRTWSTDLSIRVTGGLGGVSLSGVF